MKKLILHLQFIAILLLSGLGSAAPTIYNCTVNGRLVIQDKPCKVLGADATALSCPHTLDQYIEKRARGTSTAQDRLCITELSALKAEEDKKKEKERAAAEENAHEKWLADQESELRLQRNQEKTKARTALNKRILKAQINGGYVVEYIVTGRARTASLTYSNPQGGTEQHSVSLPWSMDFDFNGSFLSLSAQNNGDFGDVTAIIRVNGIDVKRAESSADYGIASVSTGLE